jgi:hypothetical protein
MQGKGLEAQSRGSCGRGRGRSGQVRSGQGAAIYGEGSRGRCGEGARRSPRGRMRARRRCGEGRVEDTWRCSCMITGRCGKTIEVSVRQVLHTVDEKPRGKSVRSPRHTKSSHSPCAPDASCIMQHAACSMMHAAHAPCNSKQQKCNFLHARDDSMLASMHCAVLHLPVQPKPTPKPKPRQRRANERTVADSDMSVDPAPEAVVATTSGAGG